MRGHCSYKIKPVAVEQKFNQIITRGWGTLDQTLIFFPTVGWKEVLVALERQKSYFH